MLGLEIIRTETEKMEMFTPRLHVMKTIVRILKPMISMT